MDSFILVVSKEDSTTFGWASNTYLQTNPLSQNQLEEIKYKNDPLKIGTDSLELLIGEKVPYEKWNIWGSPETLEGTNAKYWLAFLPKANISFASSKENDIIEYIGFGKNKTSKWIKRKRNARTEEIKSQFNSWDGSHINLKKEIKKVNA